MARWCPACGRPKEQHELARTNPFRVGTVRFSPVRERLCSLKKVRGSGVVGPAVFRSTIRPKF